MVHLSCRLGWSTSAGGCGGVPGRLRPAHRLLSRPSWLRWLESRKRVRHRTSVVGSRLFSTFSSLPLDPNIMFDRELFHDLPPPDTRTAGPRRPLPGGGDAHGCLDRMHASTRGVLTDRSVPRSSRSTGRSGGWKHSSSSYSRRRQHRRGTGRRLHRHRGLGRDPDHHLPHHRGPAGRTRPRALPRRRARHHRRRTRRRPALPRARRGHRPGPARAAHRGQRPAARGRRSGAGREGQRFTPEQLRTAWPAGPSRPSNPTRRSSTPTRTTWSAPRKSKPSPRPPSPATTTATAPPPDTSPCPPPPQPSCTRSSTR